MTERPTPAFLEALQAFRDALVEPGAFFTFIGGVAVIARGVPRLTVDIDATIRAPGTNVDDDSTPSGRSRRLRFAKGHALFQLLEPVQDDVDLCRPRFDVPLGARKRTGLKLVDRSDVEHSLVAPTRSVHDVPSVRGQSYEPGGNERAHRVGQSPSVTTVVLDSGESCALRSGTSRMSVWRRSNALTRARSRRPPRGPRPALRFR